VSGLLAIGILVGSGVAIGQQRYRDSVSSLKSFIQEQYNQTANTENGRTGDEARSGAVVAQPPDDDVTDPQPRGTSDCLMMGRIITVGANGKQVDAADVVGYRTSNTAPVESTDLGELQQNYKLGVSTINQSSQEVAWGAQIVKPKTSTTFSLTVLIVRSPVSGSVMTFIAEGAQTNLNAIITNGVAAAAKDLCIDPAGGTIAGQRLAVRIGAYATAQSAIEVPSEGEHVCD
jgi:hypothetical protein